MNRKRDNGSVFILFLWVLILLSLLALSIAFRARLATKIEGYDRDRFELEYDFLSGVNLARFLIDSDGESRVDFMGDNWYGTPEEFKNMDFAKRFDLEIADEESKIDLNSASQPFLIRFMEILKEHKIKLETDPEDLSAAILGWRGQAAASGASTLGFKQKRAPFQSADELRLIQHITPGDAEILLPFVTVYRVPFGTVMRFNLNTVHPYILEALIQHLTGSDFDKRALLERIEDFRNIEFYQKKNKEKSAEKNQEKQVGQSEETAQVFRQADLNPQTMITKLKLSNSPGMIQLLNQFVIFLTVDSQFYHVRVHSRLPKTNAFVLEAVLGQRFMPRIRSLGFGGGSLARPVGQPVVIPLEILSWKEGISS